VLAALLALEPGRAQAQSLEEAVRRALDRSDAVEATRWRLESARETRIQARNLRRPTVQAEIEASSVRRETDAPGVQQLVQRGEPASASLIVSQPLYLGGRFDAAARDADLRIAQAEARLRQARLLVVRDVARAYAALQRDLDVARIREEGVMLLERNLAATQSRRAAGFLGQTEISQVETRLASGRAVAATARARAAASRAALERLLGEPAGALTETVAPTAFAPATLEEAIDMARSRSDALRIASLEEDIARVAAQAARAEFAPRITLQASLTATENAGLSEGFDTTNSQIQVRAQVPLWSAGQGLSRSRAALAGANAARFDRLELEGQLVEETTRAWVALAAARETLALAAEQVAAGALASRGAALEFEVGLRSTIDVLNQEEEWQQARVAEATARAAVLDAAVTLGVTLGVDPTGASEAAPGSLRLPGSRPAEGPPERQP
jgi:outer membrane protein